MLDCRNVSVSYDGKPVVEDISFGLAPGDCLRVVGENGSGKSTLMKGLLGLLPLSGGGTVFRVSRDEVGYLPQQTPARGDFPASVMEVVLSGRLNRRRFSPFYTRRDRASAEENMERLGIASLAGKPYRALSGGQQRRALLARALCAVGKLLMLDEPSAGLDPLAASQVDALLEKLNQEGMTLIVISHDLKSAARPGGKVLHMRKKTLFLGPSEDYAKTALYRHMTAPEGGRGF
ncbi:MAG: ATP-binding cassette domain-containing protein [Synergistaceae bacterium]|jgi:zinc transport system ATP-binding protein|nr:ATP-binding cassette domain-containing protein [Synergistaceae bacterium]